MGSTNWRHVRSSPPDSRWTDQGGATPEIARRSVLAAAATLGVLASRAGSTADDPNGRLVWAHTYRLRRPGSILRRSAGL